MSTARAQAKKLLEEARGGKDGAAPGENGQSAAKGNGQGGAKGDAADDRSRQQNRSKGARGKSAGQDGQSSDQESEPAQVS